MDRDQLRRLANRTATEAAAASTEVAAAKTEMEARAESNAQYLHDQDEVVADFRDWVDYIGIDPNKEVAIISDRFTQQARGNNGAAHSNSRPLKPMSHTVENVTNWGSSRSRIVKVGDGVFAGTGDDNRSEMYVELFLTEPLVANGTSSRQLKTARPRLDHRHISKDLISPRIHKDDDRDHGSLRRTAAWVLRGKALSGRVVEDEGVRATSAIGMRILRGPSADDLIVDRGTGAARFNEGVKLADGKLALCEVTTQEATLLNRVQRHELDGPRRTQAELDEATASGSKRFEKEKDYQDRIKALEKARDIAIDHASRTRLPYPDPNVPNPLTNIVSELGQFADPNSGAVNIVRAEDI